MKKLRYLDYFILVPFLLLVVIGIVMVYSASAYWIKTQYGQAENAVMIRQIFFVLFGIVIALFFYYFKLQVFAHSKAQLILWAVTLALLFYLALLSHLKPSAAINGATAWIRLGRSIFSRRKSPS